MATKKDLDKHFEDILRFIQDYPSLYKKSEEAKRNSSLPEKDRQRAADAFNYWHESTVYQQEIIRQEFPKIFYNLGEISTGDLKAAIKTYQWRIRELPSNHPSPVFEEQRSQYQEAIDAINEELTQRKTPEETAKEKIATQEVSVKNRILSEVQLEIELQISLTQQMEEDLQKYPSQYHDFIKRKYRKALDALRDK